METETKQAIAWLTICAVAGITFGPIGVLAAWIAGNEACK